MSSVAGQAMRFARSFIKDPLAHWPFTILSRQVFGNTAGAKQNLYGGGQLLFYRLLGKRDKTIEVDSETRLAARNLRANGLLKIEQPVVPAELIAAIRDRFDALIQAKPDKAKGYIVAFGSEEIARAVPQVFELLRSPKLRGIVQEFFGSAFHVHEIVYRRTFHVPQDVAKKGEVYSDFWHCDTSPTSELALFVNLLDVDADCGPTMAVDKVHSRSLIRRHYHRRGPEVARVLDDSIGSGRLAHAFTGPAGSVMFAQTTKCLHRASIPRQGKQRDWLSIRLLPKNAPVVADRVVKNPIVRYTHGISV